jgi:hypothetical protein
MFGTTIGHIPPGCPMPIVIEAVVPEVAAILAHTRLARVEMEAK